MRYEPMDIRTSERFTYGMRIELGKLLTDENKSEVEKFVGTFECLYGQTPSAREYFSVVAHFEEIINGMSYWLEAEKNMLSSEPTPEEQQAGAKEYAEKVGELGTLVTLSKDFAIMPNELLKRPYSEIFTILYADHERAIFERKLQKVITDKQRH